MTLGEVLSKNNLHYDLYVAVTPTVTYLGRSRTYEALWLFSSDVSEPPLPVDLVTGNSVLKFFLNQEVAPTALLNTDTYSTLPAIQGWLQMHQVAVCPPSNADPPLPQ